MSNPNPQSESKSESEPESDAEDGKITFIQSHRPPLIDGEYAITVEQTVQNTNSQAPSDAAFNETYRNLKKFQVSGDRFSIDASEIESLFPPTNSQGEYKNVLPHIVFNRTTLPWERLAGDSPQSSWLALLLFDQNDPIPATTKIMAGDLQREPFPHSEGGTNKTSTLPAKAVSYPNFAIEYGELIYEPCLALDIPIDIFNTIVPGIVDLPWLSSSRIITPDDPARMGLSLDSDASSEEINTSVIVCNRLPEPNTDCTVFLVSLEGFAPYLPTGDNYTPASIKLPDGSDAESVRLLSLHSWRYRSVDPQQSFTGLLKSLDKDDDLRVFSIKDNNPGTTDADNYVRNSFKMGYSPLNHHTRQGCNTVSWYRGPFVPFAVPTTTFIPIPEISPRVNSINTADEAVRYNPDTGMMDVSYAAAWQIGRLLALQDKGFSEALYNWKRSTTLQTFIAFERMLLEQAMGETLSITANDHKNNSLIMHQAVANFIKTIAPHLLSKSRFRPEKDDDTE